MDLDLPTAADVEVTPPSPSIEAGDSDAAASASVEASDGALAPGAEASEAEERAADGEAGEQADKDTSKTSVAAGEAVALSDDVDQVTQEQVAAAAPPAAAAVAQESVSDKRVEGSFDEEAVEEDVQETLVADDPPQEDNFEADTKENAQLDATAVSPVSLPGADEAGDAGTAAENMPPAHAPLTEQPAADSQAAAPDLAAAEATAIADEPDNKAALPDSPATAAASSTPDRLENRPGEANRTAEQPSRGVVAATIASTEKRRSSGANGSAAPASTAAAAATADLPFGVPGKTLTKETQRGGSFSPAVSDPSGTKGSELKHPPGSATFELAQLKAMNGADGIDPTVKERYLADAAFQDLFGMPPDAFAAQPLWRRQQRKKDAGLF